MSSKDVWKSKIGQSIAKKNDIGTTCDDCKRFKNGWCKVFGIWISPKAGYCEAFKAKGGEYK